MTFSVITLDRRADRLVNMTNAVNITNADAAITIKIIVAAVVKMEATIRIRDLALHIVLTIIDNLKHMPLLHVLNFIGNSWDLLLGAIVVDVIYAGSLGFYTSP